MRPTHQTGVDWRTGRASCESRRTVIALSHLDVAYGWYCPLPSLTLKGVQMRTIGFVLLLLVIGVAARLVGGAAGRISAENHRSGPSKELTEFLQEMERFDLYASARTADAQNDYLTELKTSGWESLFEPYRIRDDVGLSASYQIINRAKTSLNNHKIRVAAVDEELKDQIGTLKITDKERSIMLDSFEIASRSTGQIISLEEDLMSEAESVVNLLSENESWSLENNLIVFHDAVLRSQVTLHFQNMNEILIRQKEIHEALQSGVLPAASQRVAPN